MNFLITTRGRFLGDGFLDLLWNASSVFIVLGVLFFGAIFASLICEK
jgi:hypothetical protein